VEGGGVGVVWCGYLRKFAIFRSGWVGGVCGFVFGKFAQIWGGCVVVVIFGSMRPLGCPSNVRTFSPKKARVLKVRTRAHEHVSQV